MTESIRRHGLSIGIERMNDRFFLLLKAVGKLTHEDYGIITPMIESALEGVSAPQIRVFVDGTELEGWETRAAWDDFKLGVKHNRGLLKKGRQRRSRHFAVLTYNQYAPRVKMAVALLDGLF